MDIKKTINVSTVNYSILDESGQMVERELKFPRKLSQAAAVREAKKRENDKAVIQLTVKVKTEKKIFSMPSEQFFKHSREI